MPLLTSMFDGNINILQSDWRRLLILWGWNYDDWCVTGSLGLLLSLCVVCTVVNAISRRFWLRCWRGAAWLTRLQTLCLTQSLWCPCQPQQTENEASRSACWGTAAAPQPAFRSKSECSSLTLQHTLINSELAYSALIITDCLVQPKSPYAEFNFKSESLYNWCVLRCYVINVTCAKQPGASYRCMRSFNACSLFIC